MFAGETTMTDEDGRGERVGFEETALALMAIAAGSSDAIAFLKLGTVFTSAMTGNTVLLCISLGQGRGSAALQSFAALVAFVAGAALAAAWSGRPAPSGRLPPSLVPLFVLEVACLAAFVAVWFATGLASDGATYTLIALSAIAMGVQGVAARHINVPQVNTIVFTTTIISVITSLTYAAMRAERRVPFDTKRQIGILLVYACGAVLIGALIARENRIYVWVPLAAVLAAFASYEIGRKRTAVSA